MNVMEAKESNNICKSKLWLIICFFCKGVDGSFKKRPTALSCPKIEKFTKKNTKTNRKSKLPSSDEERFRAK